MYTYYKTAVCLVKRANLRDYWFEFERTKPQVATSSSKRWL